MRTAGRVQIGAWVVKPTGSGWVWGRARPRVIGGKPSEEMVTPHTYPPHEPDVMVIVSQYVRERRGELGLTQAELAERSGIGRRTLQTVESGRGDPRLSTVLRILKELTT